MYSTSEHSSKSSCIFFSLDHTTIQCRPSLPHSEQQLILWIIVFPTYLTRGTGWCNWLRHCTTELEGHGFDSRWCQWNFSLTQPSSCTIALWSTQPLTDKNTRSIAWGDGAQGHLHKPNVLKSGSLSLLGPSVPVQACTGIALPITNMNTNRQKV